MSDVVARLNAALEGRYRVERELGEGGMATYSCQAGSSPAPFFPRQRPLLVVTSMTPPI